MTIITRTSAGAGSGGLASPTRSWRGSVIGSHTEFLLTHTVALAGPHRHRAFLRTGGGASLRWAHRARSTSWAACQPHMPCTPPPGGVLLEHR